MGFWHTMFIFECCGLMLCFVTDEMLPPPPEESLVRDSQNISFDEGLHAFMFTCWFFVFSAIVEATDKCFTLFGQSFQNQKYV